jgi:cytochrome P450
MAFVVAMMLYPEAQKKAQDEIDSVIGTSRLPSVKDQSQLQFTSRLIQEVLRWCPIVPTGMNFAITAFVVADGGDRRSTCYYGR